ncbi:MAG: SLBB domain-containing protein [Chitinophagales bacterium]|nr:SLBB domain-containing protein [Chitinophagales bacterium]
MKLFMRLLLLFILFGRFTFAQQPSTLTQQSQDPANAPSTSGYFQQGISTNIATMQLLGINPTDAQNAKKQIKTDGTGTPAGTTPASTQTTTGLSNQPQPTATPTVTPSSVQHVMPPASVTDTASGLISDTARLPTSDIFGMAFFRNKTITMFSKSTDAQAMGNYIIGLGDQISINVWGYSSFSGSYTVDEGGSIFPQGVGKIYVKGLTLDKAKQLIRSRFASYLDMKNSQIEVTIVYSRVITVNIVGEVFNPGSYSIPATNTVFNALLASNGPTDLGSLRKIYVKRQGQTVRTLDVYDFLLNPRANSDYFLQNNDYIFVPPVGKLISISGEVKRPFRYELIEGEDLSDLLNYAGGLTAKAYGASIQVRRYMGNQLKLIDVNLDSLTKSKGKYELLNGDEVFVSTVPSQLFQFVKISGAVMQPGQFNFTQGMRISDVLNKSHGLREDAITDRGYIIRKNDDLTSTYIPFNPSSVVSNSKSADNVTLKNLDEVYFFDRNTFNDSLNVNISGAVHLPGKYAYAKGMTLNDLILESGGVKAEAANAKIEISRYTAVENGAMVPAVVGSVIVGSDLSIDTAGRGYSLQPFDMVFVRSVATIDSQNIVMIKGEVLYPGQYSMTDKEEKLVDLIQRAGGLTQWASPNRATLIRVEDERGIVFMELDKAIHDPDSRYNFILRPGDVIEVPSSSDLVAISGQINYPFRDSSGVINAPYHAGKRAKFYIKKYGLGFNKEAKRSHTYVIQPGQTLQDPHRWTFIRIYPKVQSGAYVVVPLKPHDNTPKPPAAPVDINQIIESAMVKITGLLTLYVLVTRINF